MLYFYDDKNFERYAKERQIFLCAYQASTTRKTVDLYWTGWSIDTNIVRR